MGLTAGLELGVSGPLRQRRKFRRWESKIIRTGHGPRSASASPTTLPRRCSTVSDRYLRTAWKTYRDAAVRIAQNPFDGGAVPVERTPQMSVKTAGIVQVSPATTAMGYGWWD
jgi:hypothetical protein